MVGGNQRVIEYYYDKKIVKILSIENGSRVIGATRRILIIKRKGRTGDVFNSGTLAKLRRRLNIYSIRYYFLFT